MSWNVSTRLNNLQQQINNIANKGLTNPLEQILDANGYTIDNINILDGGSNSIQIKSANIGGIQMDANLNVDADISCQTLNYTKLNPPINPSGISWNILGDNVIETTTGNFTMTQADPYNGIITNTYLLNPNLTTTINYSQPDGSNSIAIGFSLTNTLYPTGGYNSVEYGVFWYPFANSIYQIINSQTSSDAYTYNNETQLSIGLKILKNTLVVFVNGNEITSLEQPITEGSYYSVIAGYVGTSITTTISVNVSQTTNETLDMVLQNGNDGGNQDITGINELTCNTLNYTTLNPPVGGGGSQNLKGVLTNGNDADTLDINNVGTLTGQNINMTGSIYCDGYLEIGDAISSSSQLHLFYGDGTSSGANYQMIATNNNILIQQYINNALYNQPLLIQDKNFIQFKSNNMLYTQDGTNNGYILDSMYYTPIYKQYYNNMNGYSSSSPSTPSNVLLFSVPVYPSTLNTTYNYGLNNVDLTFTNLQLTFTTVSATSPAPNFGANQTATMYITDTQGSLVVSNSNSIVIKLVSPNGSPTNSVSFTSTIPVILWNTTTTNKTKVYLNFLIAGIPQVGVNSYQVAMTSTNFMVNSYISQSQGGTITFGQ